MKFRNILVNEYIKYNLEIIKINVDIESNIISVYKIKDY